MTFRTEHSASSERAQGMWSDVDMVLTDGQATYGRAFVITHPKDIRLDVSMPVDAFLKTYRHNEDIEIVVRWISGTRYIDDQLMIGMVANTVDKLWEFRNDLFNIVSKIPQANITPVTDWLKDHLNGTAKHSKDRQAA